MAKQRDKFLEHLAEWNSRGRHGMNLLSREDVPEKHMRAIVAEAFSLWKELESEPEKDRAFASTLHKYGIMCPHPQHKRLYDGSDRSETPVIDRRWYDCEMCGCGVFNEHYFRELKKIETKSSS